MTTAGVWLAMSGCRRVLWGRNRLEVFLKQCRRFDRGRSVGSLQFVCTAVNVKVVVVAVNGRL
jgi:hypothetical protein